MPDVDELAGFDVVAGSVGMAGFSTDGADNSGVGGLLGRLCGALAGISVATGGLGGRLGSGYRLWSPGAL